MKSRSCPQPRQPDGPRILLRLDRGDAILFGVGPDDLAVFDLAAHAALNAATGVLVIMSWKPLS